MIIYFSTLNRRSVGLFFLFLVLVIYGLIFYRLSQSFATTADLANNFIWADSDSHEYVTLGQNIFSLGQFTRYADQLNKPEVFRTPGYPFFIGLLLKIFGSSLAIVITQIIIVGLTSWLIYCWAADWGYPIVGLVAGSLYFLDPTTIFNSFLAMSDILFVFVFLAAFYLLIVRDNFSLRQIFGGIVLLSLAVLIRSIAIFTLPIIILALLFRHWPVYRGKLLPTLLIILAGLGLVLTPWVARNWLLTGTKSLSSVGSYNLLFYDIAQFKAEQSGQSLPAVQSQYREYWAPASAYDYQSFKFSGDYSRIVREEVLHQPLVYAKFHLLKTVPFFFGSSVENYGHWFNLSASPDTNISNLVATGQFKLALWDLLANPLVLIERLIWLLLTSLALLAVLIVPGRRAKLLVIVCLILIAYFAVATGPVAMPRYRLPVAPFIFVLAGLTIANLPRVVKTAKNRYATSPGRI